MKNKVVLLIPVIAILLSGCEDPPPGLLSDLQIAMMGILLGCPGDRCNQTNELPIGVNDKQSDLEGEFNTLKSNWCPRYRLETHRIKRGDEGKLHKGSRFRVNLSVFGQVSLTSEDFDGTVRAATNGWKTTIIHSHTGSGTGMCPSKWPARQCKVKPKVNTGHPTETSRSRG